MEDEVMCPKDLIEWANSNSAIQWYLYDADLLPEQIDTDKKVCALRGFQFGWKSAMAALGNPAIPNNPDKASKI